MPGTAGGILTATQYNLDTLAGTIIARGNRTSDSTAASGNQEVLRVDNVPLLAGRSYQIVTNTLLIFSSVANDSGSARIAYSSSGTATTASTLLCIFNSGAILTTNNGISAVLCGWLHPSSNGTYSFLLFTNRVTGTGNIKLVGTVGEGTSLLVVDKGVSVGDTGVDL